MADYFTPYGNAMAYKQYPTRVISGHDILELGNEQQQTLIGHTLAYCNELESACNEAISKAEGFYARLVELGDIIPPKSTEEIMQEQAARQQEINNTLLKTIQKLTDKIDKMEGEKDERKRVSGDGSENKPTRSTANKRKSSNVGRSNTSSKPILEG